MRRLIELIDLYHHFRRCGCGRLDSFVLARATASMARELRGFGDPVAPKVPESVALEGVVSGTWGVTMHGDLHDATFLLEGSDSRDFMLGVHVLGALSVPLPDQEQRAGFTNRTIDGAPCRYLRVRPQTIHSDAPIAQLTYDAWVECG